MVGAPTLARESFNSSNEIKQLAIEHFPAAHVHSSVLLRDDLEDANLNALVNQFRVCRFLTRSSRPEIVKVEH